MATFGAIVVKGASPLAWLDCAGISLFLKVRMLHHGNLWVLAVLVYNGMCKGELGKSDHAHNCV